MALKRKSEDECGPAVKRARWMDFEDAEGIVGSLGNSTSSAHSNLLLNDKGDDVLVLDTENPLLREVVELLNDLKL
ncbi:hypothetical protein B7P43_G16755 [Cryptotermes secundus]|uniref:Uncharacterized protein n=1 Tax=Cryptotermes secundus TaxID=105785 RepID=A0A2J7RKH3_9NEOP|nr:hypothetical protein B7P43_G16755 [Cryptotermes secundus]